jgi:hypothetical protein
MKYRFFIALFLCQISLSSYAESCPGVGELGDDPYHPHPPVNWEILMPPIVDADNYHFTNATHSLNGNFYYQHVICRYDACGPNGCSMFSLISQKTYEQPYSKAPPWNERTVLGLTQLCMPPDHNETVCQFQ